MHSTAFVESTTDDAKKMQSIASCGNQNEILSFGQMLLDNSKYDQVSEFYTQVLLYEKDYPLAYLYLAAAHLKQNEPLKVMANLMKMMQFSTPDIFGYFTERNAALATIVNYQMLRIIEVPDGMRIDRLYELTESIKDQPQDSQLFLKRAKELLLLKQWDLALQDFYTLIWLDKIKKQEKASASQKVFSSADIQKLHNSMMMQLRKNNFSVVEKELNQLAENLAKGTVFVAPQLYTSLFELFAIYIAERILSEADLNKSMPLFKKAKNVVEAARLTSYQEILRSKVKKLLPGMQAVSTEQKSDGKLSKNQKRRQKLKSQKNSEKEERINQRAQRSEDKASEAKMKAEHHEAEVQEFVKKEILSQEKFKLAESKANFFSAQLERALEKLQKAKVQEADAIYNLSFAERTLAIASVSVDKSTAEVKKQKAEIDRLKTQIEKCNQVVETISQNRIRSQQALDESLKEIQKAELACKSAQFELDHLAKEIMPIISDFVLPDKVCDYLKRLKAAGSTYAFAVGGLVRMKIKFALNLPITESTDIDLIFGSDQRDPLDIIKTAFPGAVIRDVGRCFKVQFENTSFDIRFSEALSGGSEYEAIIKHALTVDTTQGALFADEAHRLFNPLGGLEDLLNHKLILVGNMQADVIIPLRLIYMKGKGEGDLSLSLCEKIRAITPQTFQENMAPQEINNWLKKLLCNGHGFENFKSLIALNILEKLMPEMAALLDGSSDDSLATIFKQIIMADQYKEKQKSGPHFWNVRNSISFDDIYSLWIKILANKTEVPENKIKESSRLFKANFAFYGENLLFVLRKLVRFHHKKIQLPDFISEEMKELRFTFNQFNFDEQLEINNTIKKLFSKEFASRSFCNLTIDSTILAQLLPEITLTPIRLQHIANQLNTARKSPEMLKCIYAFWATLIANETHQTPIQIIAGHPLFKIEFKEANADTLQYYLTLAENEINKNRGRQITVSPCLSSGSRPSSAVSPSLFSHFSLSRNSFSGSESSVSTPRSLANSPALRISPPTLRGTPSLFNGIAVPPSPVSLTSRRILSAAAPIAAKSREQVSQNEKKVEKKFRQTNA